MNATHQLRNVLRRARSLLRTYAWRRRLLDYRDRDTTIEEDVTFLSSFIDTKAHMGFWGQKPSEILALMRILAAERPHAILEIGTAIGGTLFLLSRVADPYATLVTVDLPGGDFGGGYGREWTLVLQAMPRSTQTLHLVRSDSHDPATRARLAELLPIGTVDFLLIDGDHRYEGVRQDFEFYRPFVRPGGLVAFHDIVEGPEDLVGGAPAFWREMSPEHAKQELVAGAVPPHPLDAPFGDHGGFGIGLIRV